MNLDELLPRERTPVHYRDVVADPRLDREGLRELARSPYPFVRSAVVTCPRADAATLAAVPVDDLDRWTRNSVLRDLARHPNADRPLLLTVLGRTRALLEDLDSRPYAAVLELAARPELTDAEIRALIEMPGASRRVRTAARRLRAS
ncbi:hypothetical protein BJY16_007186 [Actinoplanes octamycinicus]|uniref:Leucine rich repeat (LRR) protein n=1 Tax=Actinoplanes octamycinicus TaxID=135948 RepID=A0A7W7H4I3_9ACTN|nr:hypothetical protein [Actinoplanes octamycinicus]MBB4743727.1 hypothetical protein [Actinoplanes octamycinicus]GIE61157.1 hypothetical protein Aoc01nite_65590 [Actinoplanes octamycinicus]